jgi:hypothetical protein
MYVSLPQLKKLVIGTKEFTEIENIEPHARKVPFRRNKITSWSESGEDHHHFKNSVNRIDFDHPNHSEVKFSIVQVPKQIQGENYIRYNRRHNSYNFNNTDIKQFLLNYNRTYNKFSEKLVEHTKFQNYILIAQIPAHLINTKNSDNIHNSVNRDHNNYTHNLVLHTFNLYDHNKDEVIEDTIVHINHAMNNLVQFYQFVEKNEKDEIQNLENINHIEKIKNAINTVEQPKDSPIKITVDSWNGVTISAKLINEKTTDGGVRTKEIDQNVLQFVLEQLNISEQDIEDLWKIKHL